MSTTLPPGVTLLIMHGKPAYRARLKINGRKRSLGYYASADKAGRVFQEARRQLALDLMPTKDSVRGA